MTRPTEKPPRTCTLVPVTDETIRDSLLSPLWFAAANGDEDKLALDETNQLVSQLDAWAVTRSTTLQHQVYSTIIPSAIEPGHSARLKQVLENVFAMPTPSVQEFSHEKRNDA